MASWADVIDFSEAFSSTVSGGNDLSVGVNPAFTASAQTGLP